MKLVGRFQIRSRKTNRVVIDRFGIFTYNIRYLLGMVLNPYGGSIERITLRDVNGSTFQYPSREAFAVNQMCLIYNQLNTSYAFDTGLKALIAYTTAKYYADSYSIPSTYIEIPLIARAHREHPITHFVVYAGSFDVENDTTINSIFVVNEILDTTCTRRTVLIDVFQFSDVEIKQGEGYDATYSIAFM